MNFNTIAGVRAVAIAVTAAGLIFTAAAQAPVADAAKTLGIVVESILGPRQVHPGEEFTLTASVTGEAKVTGYLWRLKNGDMVIERKSDSTRLTTKLDALGEWFATFEVHGATGMLAARTTKFDVVPIPERPAPAPPVRRVVIERMAAPKHAFAGQEFAVECKAGNDSGIVLTYVWRFKHGNDAIERTTSEPRVTIALDKVGDYDITCDAAENGRALATQSIKMQIIRSQVAVNAGGPYNATLNRPVRVRGNARTNTGKIVKYEWFFTGGDKPEWSAAENGAAEFTYTSTGIFSAVFKVTLADGAVGVDTAIVSVASRLPTANAGGAVVSAPGRKIKLNGTGTSPDGKIVKYEWDFDGDETYDWSSDRSGEAVHAFKEYSFPVLRVTDAGGNTATDTARVVICPGNMAAVERGKYCIDKYEWPNKRGETPTTNVTWHEAAKACESAGKRLCTTDEWQRACRGDRSAAEAGARVFPYGGTAYDISKCNTIGNTRVRNKLAKSGAFSMCGGPVGAIDMSGNAAEWTAGAEGLDAPAFGGFYQSDDKASNCDARVMLEKDRKYLYTGFRCCK